MQRFLDDQVNIIWANGQFTQPSTRIVVSCIHRAFVPSHVHITVAHVTVIHIHVVHGKEIRNKDSRLW